MRESRCSASERNNRQRTETRPTQGAPTSSLGRLVVPAQNSERRRCPLSSFGSPISKNAPPNENALTSEEIRALSFSFSRVLDSLLG